MAEYDEKTEQATPRRRQKAREEGKVPRSRDLSSIAAIGGILLIFLFGGRFVMGSMMETMSRFLSLQYGTEPFTVLRAAAVQTMILIMPFLGAALVFGVASNVFQGGIAMKPFELKFDGLNPLKGLQRIFSMTGLVETFKSFFKFVVGGYLLYRIMKNDVFVLPSLMEMNMTRLAAASGALITKAALYGFMVFFTFGLVDYIVQRWQFERSIRMSTEEIKEESKESEGNPMIKARVRTLQREMARKRMMQEVPKATVVITNPTHLAIALRYEAKTMAAPTVVAKGADALAGRIRELARKHGVPIVEDKPLARLLYKRELGTVIPEELYRAVARILAYIQRLRGVAA
ncbi:MAG: flagellar biosynthesis protein FlhB [Nitrospiraceae bacterium]|nr:flagellar biosynthesis protein FlhB [Nitrospiraceae bacterium]